MPEVPELPDLDRLASLVDHRNEEPDIEYKTWMDLSSPECKSKIAKHLCALTNFGGGWIIFGVSDDGDHAEPHPGELTGYSQDIINGIVSRYLHPAFHCNVYFVSSGITEKKYPVVKVPPHGAQPVCAKTDGPLVNKTRVGVTQGTHYIRVSGPRSVPIDRPELWKDILHRCVLAERNQLLSSIGRLFDTPTTIINAPLLEDFLDSGVLRWNELQKDGWPVDPIENKSAVSFQLTQDDGAPVAPITLPKLLSGLREASNWADAECEFAVAPFDMTYAGMSPPSVFLFKDIEGYESDAILKDGEYLFAPSLSRVLVNGIGTEVRPYHEDTDWVKSAVEQRSSRKWNQGDNISPRFQAARMYAFILFVRHFSQSYVDARKCAFVVDFQGLNNRVLSDTKGFDFRGRKQSTTAKRRFRLETSLEKLLGDGALETTVSLLNPMFRLFHGTEIDAAFVRNQTRDI